MRIWLAVVAAAVAVAVIVGGIALAVRNPPTAESSRQPSRSTATPTAGTDGPAQVEKMTVPVYYLGKTVPGTRLFREFRTYQNVPEGTQLSIAVNSAVSGDSTDPDYGTAFPSGTSAQVSRKTGLVVIDLHNGSDLTSGDKLRGRLALQAVVYTADAVLQSKDPVQFLVDGKPTDRVLGVDTTSPITRLPADQVQAPVWIIDPGNESTVGRRFTVSGLAATFEANVVWELKDGARVVRRGHATARECCTASPYSFSVQAPPGRYTLVVHDTDESGRGGAVNADSKTITVR